MSIRLLIDALNTIAPPQFAADWDNVGLLVGLDSWPLSKVMLTIDCTEAVLAEAALASVDAVVAYHPPIFQPLQRLAGGDTTSRIVLEAAHSGIAIYSPHTALDAAPGGLNDWLAGGLGEGDVRAIEPHHSLPPGEACKIVTFCPADAADKIRQGLASIGAGMIGDYRVCSFQTAGHGTFLGGESTQPAVGASGALERVDEVRLEMVCPVASQPLAVAALRHLHPYEEPPIDIYALQPHPLRSVGAGRRVVLDQPIDLATTVDRIKQCLGVDRLRVAEAEHAPAHYQTIGCCPGAGGSLWSTAADQGCQLYLTGEMRHHDVIAAQQRDCTVVLAGHTNTERGYLPRLRERLSEALPKLPIEVSKRDRDPLLAM